MIWGEDDTFGRWVQFFCAIPMIGIGAAVEYYWWTAAGSGHGGWYGAGGAGLILVGLRCLWYAATGKDNINRDDF